MGKNPTSPSLCLKHWVQRSHPLAGDGFWHFMEPPQTHNLLPELFSSRLVHSWSSSRGCVWRCGHAQASSQARAGPQCSPGCRGHCQLHSGSAKVREAKWKVRKCQWNTEPSDTGKGSNIPYNPREEVTHRSPGLLSFLGYKLRNH